MRAVGKFVAVIGALIGLVGTILGLATDAIDLRERLGNPTTTPSVVTTTYAPPSTVPMTTPTTTDSPSTTASCPCSTVTTTAVVPPLVMGTISLAAGGRAHVYASSSTGATIETHYVDGLTIPIDCRLDGEYVVDNGRRSQLWFRVIGGYIPSVNMTVPNVSRLSVYD